MRNRISRRFDPAEFAALATLSPIVTALLSRHWAAESRAVGQPAGVGGVHTVAHVR